MPAAVAVPITPAILGPIACISKKFLGLACWPILWTTLAAIGTAETPAAPIIGLIFSLIKRFISLARVTPKAVEAEHPARLIILPWRSLVGSLD